MRAPGARAGVDISRPINPQMAVAASLLAGSDRTPAGNTYKIDDHCTTNIVVHFFLQKHKYQDLTRLPSKEHLDSSRQ